MRFCEDCGCVWFQYSRSCSIEKSSEELFAALPSARVNDRPALHRKTPTPQESFTEHAAVRRLNGLLARRSASPKDVFGLAHLVFTRQVNYNRVLGDVVCIVTL